jgi:hypothetical protein
MKVRIKKAPQIMAYGGQKKHSLDIVRTTIDDYKPDFNDVERKNTRGADPRGESNAELEGREIVVQPNKQVYKVVGPDHNPDPNKPGGVPMNLPEGSFVFSKRKLGGMGVKGAVLKNFGKSENDKKTYSFAELAEQYNPNKFYDAIVNGAGKLDTLTLNTLAANIQRYEDKLADLAILQESKKGFPQGVPDIAKEKFAKMQQYMQQSQQQQGQEMPMAMHGYNMNYGGFVPDYSSVGDMYRYQSGGASEGQDKQIVQYIQAYAQLAKRPVEEIYQALESLAPAQKQEALQNIVMSVQKVMSEQQAGGQEQQMQQQDMSGYYSAPGGEPDYNMSQEEEQMPEEEQQMQKGGSYSGTYYQGTYFQNGGAFMPSYGDSAYNDQFGGEIYDYDEYALPRADGGLEVKPPRKIKKEEVDAYIKDGWTRVEGTNILRRGNKKVEIGTYKPGKAGYVQKGTPGTSPEVRQGRSGGKAGKAWEDWIKAQLAKGVTIEELAKKGHGTVSGLQKYKPYYKPVQSATPDVVVPEEKGVCLDEKGNPDPTLTYNTQTKRCEKVTSFQEEVIYEEPQEGPKVPTQGKTGDFGYGNYGVPFESTLGIAAAAAYPPLYLRPFYAEPEAVIPRPTFYSPERELASAQETARGLEQMATIMNPQSAGAMANYIQSNAAPTAANILGKYNNLNVGVANQFSPLQAQIYNSLAAQKRETKDKRYLGETVALQQYTDAMRKYATNVAQTLGEGIQAGKKLGQLYDTNPYYYADTFGRLRLKPGVNAADAIMYGTTAGRSSSLTPEQYLQQANELKNKYPGYKDEMYRDALRQKYGTSRSSSKNDDDDVSSNYGYGQSAYPFA